MSDSYEGDAVIPEGPVRKYRHRDMIDPTRSEAALEGANTKRIGDRAVELAMRELNQILDDPESQTRNRQSEGRHRSEE